MILHVGDCSPEDRHDIAPYLTGLLEAVGLVLAILTRLNYS